MRIAFDDGDQLLDSGLLEVRAGQFGARVIQFEGGEMAAGLFKGDAEPHAGYARGRADLDHVFGIDGLHQHAQHSAVRGGHVGVEFLGLDGVANCGKNPFLKFGFGQGRIGRVFRRGARGPLCCGCER